MGVYIAADNGMSEQAAVDIAEMMRVGSTAQVNIVVQVDNAARDTNPGCRRYLVRRDTLVLLENLGEVDMADTNTLADFIGFLGSRFPAGNYFLVIWDHGDGWYEGYGPARAVIIDESSGHMMGVAGGELRRALESGKSRLGKRLKVLAFDACLMGSIEIACEVMEFADYLLASPAVVPWDGFPYERFLERLCANPFAQPEEFLPEMCADYVAAFPGDNVCLSSINLRQLERVLPVLRAVLQSGVDPGAAGFRAAREGVQTFPDNGVSPPDFTDEQIDLVHFWELAPGAGLEGLRQTLNPLVIGCSGTGYYSGVRGISVWFPARYTRFKRKTDEYRKLQFARLVPHLEFLARYYGRDDVKPTTPEIIKAQVGRSGDVRLWWRSSFDLLPVMYQLYQLSGMRTVFSDRCESLGGNWEGNGWTVSTRYFHSPPSAFFSGSGPNLDNNLISTQPLQIGDAGIVSFYARYSTEESEEVPGEVERDVCYIEWSQDQSEWWPLDSLYGPADYWQECRYLVGAGPVYLRFRYRTNDNDNRLGVFIDDVRVEGCEFYRQVLTTADTAAFLFNLQRDTGGYRFCVCASDAAGNRSMLSQLCYPVRIERWAEPYTIPAPLRGDGFIVLDFPEGERPEVSIYTLSGVLVKRFRPDSASHLIRWNGTNDEGRKLADGVYLVVVKGKRFKKLGRIAVVSGQ